MDTATKAGINPSKNVVHKAAKATGEFLRNISADAVAKSYDNKIVTAKPIIDKNLTNIEEIIISSEKREEILNGLKKVS